MSSYKRSSNILAILAQKQKFTIFSDHKPLEKLNIKARTDEELGDIVFYLSQYDIDIKYCPGKYNMEADCLSRNPVLEANENGEDNLQIVNMIRIQEIINDQKNNEEIQKTPNKLLKFREIYYKKSRNKNKIVLSEEYSKSLIKKTHEEFCHIGIKQLQNKINPFYTTKNLEKNIKVCKNCDICIKNKSRGQPKIGLMSHLGPATKPFDIISIDTNGGFGGNRSTKKYLHLMVDHYTRYAYILTSKTQSSNDFIKLVKTISDCNNIGMILTDQYPGINSREFKDFLQKQNIPIIFTATNTPFSNGLNERLNQTLVNKIRCKINEKGNKSAWTTIAHQCTDRYNNTEHTVTGFSPKYLLEGQNISIIPKQLKQVSTNNLETDRKTALANTIRSHNYNKSIFDKNRVEHEFKVGDLVYVENGHRLNRKKLDELRSGPFKILEKISNSIFKIDTGYKNLESNWFHITKLTPHPSSAARADFSVNFFRGGGEM